MTRYQSGEEPQVGDVVEPLDAIMLDEFDESHLLIVDTVYEDGIGIDGPGLCEPRCFKLIRRAGDGKGE